MFASQPDDKTKLCPPVYDQFKRTLPVNQQPGGMPSCVRTQWNCNPHGMKKRRAKSFDQLLSSSQFMTATAFD